MLMQIGIQVCVCVCVCLQEFTKMVQMLQGYCLVSTGVRIVCYNQTGKR